MLYLCAHCKSADTVAGLTLSTCLECGKQTDTQGRAVPPGPTFGDMNPGAAGAPTGNMN